MLNVDFIESLYKGLTKEKKHELKGKLFGGSNQSLSYFRKNRDTSMSKLEILADFFNLPLDALRTDSDYVYDNRIKKIVDAKRVVKDGSTAAAESKSQSADLSSLELETQQLQIQNQILKDTIVVREERIEVLLDRIAILREKLERQGLSKTE